MCAPRSMPSDAIFFNCYSKSYFFLHSADFCRSSGFESKRSAHHSEVPNTQNISRQTLSSARQQLIALPIALPRGGRELEKPLPRLAAPCPETRPPLSATCRRQLVTVALSLSLFFSFFSSFRFSNVHSSAGACRPPGFISDGFLNTPDRPRIRAGPR